MHESYTNTVRYSINVYQDISTIIIYHLYKSPLTAILRQYFHASNFAIVVHVVNRNYLFINHKVMLSSFVKDANNLPKKDLL